MIWLKLICCAIIIIILCAGAGIVYTYYEKIKKTILGENEKFKVTYSNKYSQK